MCQATLTAAAATPRDPPRLFYSCFHSFLRSFFHSFVGLFAKRRLCRTRSSLSPSRSPPFIFLYFFLSLCSRQIHGSFMFSAERSTLCSIHRLRHSSDCSREGSSPSLLQTILHFSNFERTLDRHEKPNICRFRSLIILNDIIIHALLEFTTSSRLFCVWDKSCFIVLFNFYRITYRTGSIIEIRLLGIVHCWSNGHCSLRVEPGTPRVWDSFWENRGFYFCIRFV